MVSGRLPLSLSLVANTTWPLLTISLALSWAARRQLIHRDHFTFVVALTPALTMSAAGVAVDEHLDTADALLDLSLPLLGLTVLAVIWSALGRRRPA